MIPYFLGGLRSIPDSADGETNLLENTIVLYGSAMGDSNLHNHKRVPFFIAGHGAGALKGGVHHKAPNGTPLANVMLGLLHAVGMHDIRSFGDSEGAFDLAS